MGDPPRMSTYHARHRIRCGEKWRKMLSLMFRAYASNYCNNYGVSETWHTLAPIIGGSTLLGTNRFNYRFGAATNWKSLNLINHIELKIGQMKNYYPFPNTISICLRNVVRRTRIHNMRLRAFTTQKHWPQKKKNKTKTVKQQLLLCARSRWRSNHSFKNKMYFQLIYIRFAFAVNRIPSMHIDLILCMRCQFDSFIVPSAKFHRNDGEFLPSPLLSLLFFILLVHCQNQ